MKTINEEKVLLLHKLLMEENGENLGVMDYALLSSALKNAYQTFGGQELYPTKQEKGACLGFSLISNHAFFDENKRIGTMVMLSFLDFNGIKLKYTEDEIKNLSLKVANSTYGYEEIIKFIKTHEYYPDATIGYNFTKY